MKILVAKLDQTFVEPCCGQFVGLKNKGKVFSNDFYSTYAYLSSFYDCDFKELKADDDFEEVFSHYDHVIFFCPLGNSKEELLLMSDVVKKARKSGSSIIGVIKAHGYIEYLMQEYLPLNIALLNFDILASLESLKNQGWFDSHQHVEKRVIGNRDVAYWKFYQDGYSFLNVQGQILKEDYMSLPLYRKQRCLSAGIGCPAPCRYCQLRLTKWRSKKASQLVDEIEFFNGTKLELYHTNLFFRGEWLEDVLKKICERKLNVDIRTLGRIDDIAKNRHLLTLCHQAGISQIDVGLESVHPRVLSSMDKSTNDIKDLEIIYQEAKDLGIRIQMNILIGMPEEDHDSLEATYNFIKKFGSTINCSILRPEPDSGVYEDVLSQGLVDPNELSFEKYMYRLENFSQHEAHVPTKYLSKEEVSYWHQKICEALSERRSSYSLDSQNLNHEGI